VSTGSSARRGSTTPTVVIHQATNDAITALLPYPSAL
jgi:hypothetical protein